MHTHTYWSDGDDYPENVAKWYKENGYDFLVFTDHNIIHEGERWRQDIRLKTFDEYRSMYEEPGNFLIIMGNEISNSSSVHLLAFQQDRVIPVSRGSEDELIRIISETVRKVDEGRNETGRNHYAVLAHPNFQWAITAEMIFEVPDLRFFEVYNGHPSVNNEGNNFRASTERIWDIVLSRRLSGENGKLLYGIAADDAHHYRGGGAGPGRGWVMVKAKELTPESILDAIDKGYFYASTGVRLKKVSYDGKTIEIQIEPEEGVDYLTEFIGTPKGFDSSSVPTVDATGNEISNTTRTYSDQIGMVLESSDRVSSSYTFAGSELYVRVRVTSTADQIDPVTGKILGKQKAWIQPQIQIND